MDLNFNWANVEEVRLTGRPMKVNIGLESISVNKLRVTEYIPETLRSLGNLEIFDKDNFPNSIIVEVESKEDLLTEENVKTLELLGAMADIYVEMDSSIYDLEEFKLL